jgi:hypothetical protein
MGLRVYRKTCDKGERAHNAKDARMRIAYLWHLSFTLILFSSVRISTHFEAYLSLYFMLAIDI